MPEDKGAGWLSGLETLFHADGLEAWIAKLVAVVVVLLIVTAIVAAFQARGARPVKRASGGARPRLATRAVPSKNRKKKRDKIVRRYRPKSHDGKKPIRRTGLGTLAKPRAPVAAAIATRPAASPPARKAAWSRDFNLV